MRLPKFLAFPEDMTPPSFVFVFAFIPDRSWMESHFCPIWLLNIAAQLIGQFVQFDDNPKGLMPGEEIR